MEKFAIIGFGCAGYHALTAIREYERPGVLSIIYGNRYAALQSNADHLLCGRKSSLMRIIPLWDAEGDS